MASVSGLARAVRQFSAACLPRLPRTRGVTVVVGVIVFIGALLVSEFTYSLLQRELAARSRADALRYASALRASIERELNSVLYLSSGLASYLAVRRNNLDADEVQEILADLFRDAHHVRNFGIAVGYRLTYVYPQEGNAAAVGLYYPDHANQWPQVRHAIESQRGTLAGPVRLVQGGEGLVYRVPVRIKGEYWGLLSTVIDNRSLLAAATRDLPDEPYDFAIRGRDGEGALGEVFVGKPVLFEGRSVTLETRVPNGSWVLAVQPHGNVVPRYARVLRMMGWVLAALIGIAVAAILNHRIDLTQLALLDPLTLLPNRRCMEDNLTQALDKPVRDRGCGLLFVDLDGFKAVNDTYGHKAGDALLKTVCERVARLVRSQDTVARWGGDELVLLIEGADREQLESLAKRLRAAVEQTIAYDGLELRVGASIGHALAPADGNSARELLKVADQRMYDEKQRRKGRAQG